MDQGVNEDTELRSKEAQAMAALGVDPNPPYQPRRRRRRRRSLRRRIVDGIMPFLVVLGLTLFAAGLVQVVEIGAAKSSKPMSNVRVEPVEISPEQQFDYELAQREYRDLMRKHAESRGSKVRPQNQVAYQLSLQNDAIRELDGLPQRIQPENEHDDVIDWSLFEDAARDPTSSLKRGVTRLPRSGGGG